MKEESDPEEPEYKSIAERIRNKANQRDQKREEFQYNNSKSNKEEPTETPAFVQDIVDTSENLSKSSNQMMNRLQTLKDQ